MAGEGLDTRRIHFGEEFLISSEKLERNSPLLWPENSLFSELNPIMLPSTPELPKWTSEPHMKSTSDEKLEQELSLLSDIELEDKVKMLKKLAYQLEQEEAKEIQRTKCLNIFSDV